jgi:hypothetical protein
MDFVPCALFYLVTKAVLLVEGKNPSSMGPVFLQSLSPVIMIKLTAEEMRLLWVCGVSVIAIKQQQTNDRIRAL